MMRSRITVSDSEAEQSVDVSEFLLVLLALAITREANASLDRISLTKLKKAGLFFSCSRSPRIGRVSVNLSC